ncbi:MAG: hypothetical protein AMK73_03415, partial [Planctomycetes bacterium SM23_32]
ALQLIDMAGDNIANANTPGYHVKRAFVSPVIGPTTVLGRVGLGSTVEDIVRLRSALVEQALLSHTQVREKLGEEVELLNHLGMLFTEPSSSGLDAQMEGFFDAVGQLAAEPDNTTLREAVVQKADSVCELFQRLDAGFQTVEEDLAVAAEYAVGEINALTERIAALNKQVQLVETGGTSAPGLKDTRDELITRLSELINVTVHEVEFGVANVSCAGTLLVNGAYNKPIEMEVEDGQIVVAAEGSIGHLIPVREGRLAGIIEVANELLPGYRQTLDDLANAFRRAVNMVHTTALGLGGRFDSLEGTNAFLGTDPVSDLGYGVPAGTTEKLVINVEDEATGDVTQYELTLDTTQAADAFLVALRDDINANVDHLTASIDEGRLRLEAEDGYAFGFATPYDANPAQAGDITALDPTTPTIADAYTGQTDLVYDVTFLDAGEIGADSITIQVEVSEPGGPVLRTLTRTIDDTYPPGSAIALENGLLLCLSAGNVAAGDSFSFTARASMDTAGILDALGLNTLFSGLGAGDIHVTPRVYDDPSSLAGAVRPLPGDNHRLLDLADVSTAKLLASGTATLGEHYRALVTGVATTRNTRLVAFENQEQLVKDLQNQRDSISGVSVDEEMVRIIQSRTIYQGAMKYIAAIDQFLSDLAALV